jgi:Tetratricopeptide repeat
LPLALEQAGAVLFEGRMAVGEYLRLLRERTARILEQGASPDYPTSMTAAWQISVARLRQQSPRALELLRCCAFLGPEPIPSEVFKFGSEESQTGVGSLIADPIELSTAISALGRFALVRMDGPYITVHRLIQALLRDELDPEDQRRYRQDAHSILAAGAPGTPTDVNSWPKYADLVAHIGSSAMDLAHCQMPAHRAFALDVVRYLFVSGDFVSCRSFAERFIAQWTEDSGPDDPYVLDAKRHLGNALRESGEAGAAYQLVKETLESAERVLKLSNPLTLHLRNAFGADLRARGDFGGALTLDQATRALHDEVFGPTDPQTLRVMNNVALDYGLNSRFTESRDLHKEVYVLQRDTRLNTSATEVLSSWTNLARAVRLCGNFVQARDLGEDARRYGLHELGLEHYLTLRAATDLSIAMRRIPEAGDEALELAANALELCRRYRGETNPDTMAAAISLSNLQCALGQLDQALELAKATAQSYPTVYGADHPYNYGVLANLAMLRRLTGDPAEARRLNETALAGLDARLGRDHLFYLTTALNLASDLAALGETGQARARGEDCLTRLTKLVGGQHPVTLGCAANLVQDLRADGAAQRADSLLTETISGYANTLGADHPMTEAAMAGSRVNWDFDPPPI